MGRIHRLPTHIADQIAAGEVVERPASVVRELLENAIDAGATDIRVEVQDGGKRLIRVTDNGCGMDREDIELATERHATSKIHSEHDLSAIRTLGFRGEAIPSMASVSRFTMTSRAMGEDTGWRVRVDFGRNRRIEPAGCPVGTTVDVEDLFLKIPARLRFLKRRQTEAGHVFQQVRLHAVAHPHIRFSVKSDGRQVLQTSGEPSYPHALWPLLGRELVDTLLPVQGQGPGIEVYGFIAPPDQGRSSSRAFYFFLNGRNIGNRMLWKALNEATKGIYMSKTYPVGALFLKVNAEDVDVNVHPTKQEVRFHSTDAVYRAVYHSVRRALEKGPDQPGVKKPALPADTDSHRLVDENRAGINTNIPLPWEEAIHMPKQDMVSELLQPDRAEVEEDQGHDVCCPLKAIGQLDSSYILAEGPDGLVIIDQHAAHEAILFKRLLNQFKERGAVTSQPLIFPEVIEVQPEDAARIHELLPILEKLGIEAEPFGPSQISVRSMPDFLSGHKTASTALRDILDRIFDAPATDASNIIHETLASLACHSAIRAKQELTLQEMQALMQQIHEEEIRHCPHGRPVTQLIGFSEIQKNFRRT